MGKQFALRSAGFHIVSLLLVFPCVMLRAESNPFSADITHLHYQDGSGRQIDYDFLSGSQESSGAILLPEAAIIQRPPTEMTTLYLWEQIRGTQQLNTTAGYCRMSIPQASGTMLPVPTASIVIDGSVDDWTAVDVYAMDQNTGDDYPDAPGSDIEYVKLAYNPERTRLNILIKVTDAIDWDILYRVLLAASPSDIRWPGSMQIDLDYPYDSWNVTSFVCGGDYQWYRFDAKGQVAVNGAFLEASVDLAPGLGETFYLWCETIDWYYDYLYDTLQAVQTEVEGVFALGADGPVAGAPEDWQFQVRLSNFANTGMVQHNYGATIGGGTWATQYENTETPYKTITVNGDPADWADVAGAVLVSEKPYSGTPDARIQRISTAMDDTYVYFMVQTGAALAGSDVVSVELQFNYEDGQHFYDGDHDDIWIHVYLPDEEVWGWRDDVAWVDLNADVAVGEVLEVRIPRSELGDQGYFNATYASTWKSDSVDSEDAVWVDPVISPMAGYGFFTGWHEGTYYENILHLWAEIDSEHGRIVRAESEEVLLTGYDPASTVVDIRVKVTGGQTATMDYRINDSDWQSLWSHTIAAGRMLGFIGQFPYVALETEYIPQEEISLNISGVVTDAHTGQWLENIYVGCWNDDTQQYFSTRTGSAGEYEFTDLPAGEVYIMVEPESGSPYARVGRDIDLAADMSGVNFALPQAATLSGRVVDAQTASPIGDIRIGYWSERYSIWQDAWSNADGSFTLTNLPPGMADIEIESWADPDYIWLSWPANLIYLDEAQEVSGRVIALRRGLHVWGYVKDVHGQPVPWLDVEAQGAAYEADTETDADGRYEFYLLPGSYTVSIDYDEDDNPATQWAALPVGITVGQSGEVNVPDIIAYSSTTGLQISGTVNNIAPLPNGGFFVTALPAGTQLTADEFALAASVCGTAPSDTGEFVIPILPPGDYDIYLAAEYWDIDDVESFAICDKVLNVAAGTTALALNAALPQGSLHGVVGNVTHRPVLGASIFIANAANGQFVGIADAGPDGYYQVRNLAAGTYTLTVIHSKYQTIEKVVVVKDGLATQVDPFVMSFAGGKEASDLNGDGVTDSGDLILFAEQWLGGGDLQANLDQAGAVDMADLSLMAALWRSEAMWTLTGAAQEPGLVGHWKMDDCSATTVVLDAGGNGFHGTAARNTADICIAGVIDGAMTFNGAGDHVRVQDSALLSPSGEFTICGWFAFDNPAQNAGLVWKHNYNFALHTVSDRVRFSVWNDASQESRTWFSTSLLKPGWNYIAAVFDGTAARLYLNGAAAGAAGAAISGGARDRAGDLYIGMRPDGVGDVYFTGAMDDIRIYDRALTLQETESIRTAAP